MINSHWSVPDVVHVTPSIPAPPWIYVVIHSWQRVGMGNYSTGSGKTFSYYTSDKGRNANIHGVVIGVRSASVS